MNTKNTILSLLLVFVLASMSLGAGPLFYDRVLETTTVTGTGTATLLGAKSGYRSFSVVGDGNTCPYLIRGGTEWEIGIGTYTASGTTLARTTVISSSNSNSPVSFSAGTKDVGLITPAVVQQFAVGTTGSDFNFAYTAGGVPTFHLPDASASARGVVTTGAQTIAGAKTFSSAPTFSSLTAGSIPFISTGGFISQDNAALFWDAANDRLGIKTTSPGETLQVAGAVKVTGSAVTNLASSGAFDFSGGFARVLAFGPDAATRGKISFQIVRSDGTSLLAPLTVAADGNVGISDSTPGEKLQVAGALKVTGALAVNLASAAGFEFTGGNTRVVSWGANTSTRGGFQLLQLASNGSLSLTPLLVDTAGNIGFHQSSFGTSAVKVLAIGSGTAPSTSPADAAQMWVADRGGTAGKAGFHIRSEDGTSHVFSDLVGIGTTSPESNLHVSGDSSSVIRVASTAANVAYCRYKGTGADWFNGLFGTTAWELIDITGGTVMRLRVDQTTGNVGIGQASFGTNGVRVLGIASGTAPSTSPADAAQMWVADRGGTAGKSGFHFRSEDGTSHVFSDFSGFNTTTPGATLEIKDTVGTVLANIFKITSSNNGSYLSVFDNSSSGTAFDPAFLGYHDTGGNTALQFVGGMDAGQDSAAKLPLILFQGRRGATAGSAVTARDILSIANYDTDLLLVKANGNFGFNQNTFGTSAAKVIAVGSGTAPSTSPADAVQMWSADRGATAGKAGLHIRSEDGTSHVFSDRVGIGTTSPGGLLDIASSVQASNRLLLSGQEYYAASNTSTSGVAMRLGINRTSNRQLWIADSATAVNGSEAQFRVLVGEALGYVLIGSLSTNGDTLLPLNISASNLGLNTATFGSSAAGVFAIASGTAPGSSPADAAQIYSADVTAGNAAIHTRTEGGAIIKLYQQPANADTSGATLGNLETEVNELKALLRNNGLLGTDLHSLRARQYRERTGCELYAMAA